MPEIRETTGPEGIRVTVTTGQAQAARIETRFALALRRQAANRARVANGREPLSSIKPGPCPSCEGWGVVGKHRAMCAMCGGSGG